jgi:BirA family biotin operon repressor/biotin-[acetyl-CoA-carboxylase] ligase
MNIIKLSAIDSTNDYMHKMSASAGLVHGTIVRADYQSNGRGQFDRSWESKQGENLMFSLFFKGDIVSHYPLSDINWCVCLAILDTLKSFKISNLSIKWPNDIMAGGMKLSGILIETKWSSTKLKHAVIGIGLNVNQKNFSSKLRATSLSNILENNIDLELLFLNLRESLLKRLETLKTIEKHDNLKLSYEKNLFSLGKPRMFESRGKQFMGIIRGVNDSHQLRVEREDETVGLYDHAQIKMML